jgi:microsomal dipeptidase-like Zn-dependent dipeptidase
MNRLGMVIDLSHVGERTSLDAIAASARPVAVTHANPKRFHDVARNKSDAVLRALTARGGVLGFSLYPLHIGGSDVALEAVVAMIARTAEQIGVEHLGFGTDMCRGWSDDYLAWMRGGRWTFDQTPARWPAYPAWFASPGDFPNLTEGLMRAGFAEAEVAAIMGGNWLRFFTEGFRPSAQG